MCPDEFLHPIHIGKVEGFHDSIPLVGKIFNSSLLTSRLSCSNSNDTTKKMEITEKKRDPRLVPILFPVLILWIKWETCLLEISILSRLNNLEWMGEVRNLNFIVQFACQHNLSSPVQTILKSWKRCLAIHCF